MINKEKSKSQGTNTSKGAVSTCELFLLFASFALSLCVYVFLLRKVIGWQKFLDRRYPQGGGLVMGISKVVGRSLFKEAWVPFLFKVEYENLCLKSRWHYT